jgi:hypothetical protein
MKNKYEEIVISSVSINLALNNFFQLTSVNNKIEQNQHYDIIY